MRSATLPARAVQAVTRPFARFRRDETGATAVEFGLIALPFIALLLAIIETALLYFAGSTLENATAKMARLIRTGEAQKASMSQSDFKQAICDQVSGLINCTTTSLQLDVKTFTTFDSINLQPPLDANGNLDTSKMSYTTGKGGDIVVVRVYYEWPTFSHLLGLNFSNLADGNHLLAATAAFKNEPFPW
jgi:Flp pilus assembly protein TadG